MTVRQEDCDRRHKFLGWLITTIIAFMGLVILNAGLSYSTSATAVERVAETQRALGEHVAADEEGDKAIQETLHRIEAAQVRLGERLNKYFERDGE